MEIILNNKNAIVCGSTQGIGKATAIELALMGANVTLIARDKNKLASVVSNLDTKQGQSHSYLCVDFSNTDELRTKLKSIDETYHILINNTGGPAGGPITEANTESFENAFKMHLINNQILAQSVIPGMIKEGYGRIVNIISTSVKAPIAGLGVSNTIRAAVANWAKTLSLELGSYGITVNNVLPGFTNTNRLKSLIEKKSSILGKSTSEVEKEMKKSVPLNRFGEAEEVANAVVFLSSPAASYISGINLPVDGGRTASL